MQLRPSILACALGLACLLPATAQDGTKARPEAGGGLRWKLEKGSRTPFTFTWLLEESLDFKGLGMPPQQMTNELSFALTQEVKSVDAGVATIEATIDAIKMRIGLGMMGDMGFDSKNGDDPQNPVRFVRHGVGKKFTFKLGSDGKVSDVSGSAAVAQAVSDGLKADQAASGGGQGGQGGGGGMGGMMGMDPSAMAGTIGTQLIGIVFSDSALTSGLKLVHECLPAEAAAKTWNRDVDITIPQAGRIKFKADMSNAGEAEGNVRIGVKQSGEVDVTREAGSESSGDPMADQMRKMMGETKMVRKEARGGASFSSAKGHLIDSEMVLEIESEGEIPPFLRQMLQQQGGGGDLPEEMKLARTTSITLRLVQEGTASAPAPEGEKKPAEKKGSERF